MLTRLRSGLQQSPISQETGTTNRQAAVLLALTDHPSEPEIVLTKRAEHLNSHSGQVAFPGGKWDETDKSLMETALRESHEEIGLPPERVEVLASLPSAETRFGIHVTPFVGVVPKDLQLEPNYDELDAIFNVPVSYFLDDDNRSRTDIFEGSMGRFWAPVWHYEGFEIWGFTAGILANFLNQTLNAGLGEESQAPVKIFA
ncbi:CoA pyrophosphatase [Pseudoteredinibacter isoporae]|uniref:CoA pyrophosphatase n=1 Tax=Pseudoteredinibacter isoporae TaxID=570281 RepID=UPI0031057132